MACYPFFKVTAYHSLIPIQKKLYPKDPCFQETVQVTYILLSSDPLLTLFPTTRFFTPSITNCDPVFMNRENIALKKKDNKAVCS